MEGIDLIRAINDTLTEKDPFEKALEESGITLSDGGANTSMEFDLGDNNDELQRIADHWKEEGQDMSEDELRDAIGNDLEQLEYTPEQIASGISTVMSKLGYTDEEPAEDDTIDTDDTEI